MKKNYLLFSIIFGVLSVLCIMTSIILINFKAIDSLTLDEYMLIILSGYFIIPVASLFIIIFIIFFVFYLKDLLKNAK